VEEKIGYISESQKQAQTKSTVVCSSFGKKKNLNHILEKMEEKNAVVSSNFYRRKKYRALSKLSQTDRYRGLFKLSQKDVDRGLSKRSL
jgi:hypothetical protein